MNDSRSFLLVKSFYEKLLGHDGTVQILKRTIGNRLEVCNNLEKRLKCLNIPARNICAIQFLTEISFETLTFSNEDLFYFLSTNNSEGFNIIHRVFMSDDDFENVFKVLTKSLNNIQRNRLIESVTSEGRNVWHLINFANNSCTEICRRIESLQNILDRNKSYEMLMTP